MLVLRTIHPFPRCLKPARESRLVKLAYCCQCVFRRRLRTRTTTTASLGDFYVEDFEPPTDFTTKTTKASSKVSVWCTTLYTLQEKEKRRYCEWHMIIKSKDSTVLPYFSFLLFLWTQQKFPEITLLVIMVLPSRCVVAFSDARYTAVA